VQKHNKRRLMSVRIPVSLYSTLQQIARMLRDSRGDNVAVSELVVQAVEQYVKRMTGVANHE
jgi:hypothetical protein